MRRKESYPSKKMLITAGPTREYMDPVRYISNPSSGLMGIMIAEEAHRQGIEVDLILGPTHLRPSKGISCCTVNTADEMFCAFKEKFADCDILVMSAAVSDFKPRYQSRYKTKKEQVSANLALKRNPDILAWAGRKKNHQLIIGFAAQTHLPLIEGKRKMLCKNADMMVVNIVGSEKSGFASQWLHGTLIDRRGCILPLKMRTKKSFARMIVSKIKKRKNHAGSAYK